MNNNGVDVEKIKNYGTKSVDVNNDNLKQLRECDFLDFKSEWHKENGALLYDILCLCNSLSNVKERYIIFGVKEDADTKNKTYNTVLEKSERKTDESLENLLHEYFDRAPKFSIYQLEIDSQIIDVLRFFPDPSDLPYYLRKEYKYNNIIVQRNTIYARNGRTNFPRNEGVPPYYIEQLFAIKHGQHLSARDRGFFYLNDIEQWLDNKNDQKT